MCRYDLHGIPDGVCPECGTPFLIAELESRSFAAVLQREVSVAWALALLALMWLIFMPAFPKAVPDSSRWPSPMDARIVHAACGWILYAWWLGRRRERVLTGKQLWPLLLGAIPMLPTMWCDFTRGEIYVSVIIAAGAVYSAVTYSLWRATATRSAWVLPFSSAIAYAVSGLMIAGVAAARLFMGMTWSVLHDPRAGQVFDQYPLRNDEAVLAGLPVLGLAAGLAILALVFRVRAPGLHPRKGSIYEAVKSEVWRG